MGTRWTDRFTKVHIYIYSVVGALGIVLFASTMDLDFSSDQILPWLAFATMFAAAEYAVVLFHHGSGRQGLSLSEAVLIPMLVALPLAEVLWAVVVGTSAVAIAHRRFGSIKGVFNVAQYGCAAAVAAGVWGALGSGSVMTPRNAAALAAAAVGFAVLTHLFVTLAIALSEGRSPRSMFDDVSEALGWNLFGNVSLGLVFAAAYLAEPWTAVLFVPPLIGLFYGYRAVLRQEGEKDRVEKLHEASRALAASPDLRGALAGFLVALEKIVSAAEVRAVVRSMDGLAWSAVRGGEVTALMDPVAGDPIEDLLQELHRSGGSLIIQQGEAGPRVRLAEALGARSLVAVSLEQTDGCLVALDRIGPDEFADQEVRLLEALSQELVLSLDSYRLFDEIAEERERFERIFTGSQEGICLVDAAGVVRAWNPALEKITGYVSSDMVGQVWSDRLVLRTSEQHRLEGRDLIEAPSDQVYEVMTREGPTRWVALVAGPVARGQDKGWVILMRDVTDEQALEHAKSDFLSTVSHELRTPLTAIKGSLGILSRGDSVPQPVRDQMLGVLQRGSDRLERLVLNLLFVSQIDTDGSLQVMRQELDVKELLKDRVRSMAQDREVELELEEGSILARGDRERLGQAVDHLLENALKFDLEGPIKVAARRMNGFIEVSVVDNGPGIPEEDQERIFDRFVRLGSVLTRETQGPGIGLFIAREAVQAMGGSVAVVSRPGEGAAFSIRLPASRPMEVAPGQSA